MICVAPRGGRSNSGPDASPAIQAAVDNALANGGGTLVIPAGDYRLSTPIFLDDPRNLRVSKIGVPFTSSFSLRLLGHGARLWTDFNDDVGLWIGPGRGMIVDGLSISGPPPGASGFRLGLPSGGLGIGLAAYGSGTLIENCSVNLFRTGIMTSANNVDELCDATTVRKCAITGGVGISFLKTNNLINSVEDCVVDAVVGVDATAWNGVHVRGGNFSSNLAGNVFPISAAGVPTLQNGGAQTAYQITIAATVGSPDALFLAGAYNAFAIVTQHFGIVPMVLTGWNAGTGVAIFVVLDAYSGSYFAGWANDPATKTNLVVELQAATKLYAAERVTTFQGTDVYVEGVHIENGSTPTTVIDGWYGTPREGGGQNSLHSVRVNGSLSNDGLGPLVVAGTASPAQQAQFCVSRSWPQFRVGATELTVDQFTMDPSDERLIVDFFNTGSRLNWHGAGPKLQLRTPISGYPFTGGPIALSGTIYQTGSPAAFGAGDFEANPFYGTTLLSDADSWRSPWGPGRAPMRGIRPAPWATPGVTVAQAAMLAGTLPPLTLPGSGPVNVQYPLLWGGQIYRLQDWYIGAQPTYQLVSSHHFYSYGQPLPVSWSHIGQSPFLYVSDTRLLFPGLGIQIDHGDGPQLYLVTGVYPTMGYVTVLKGVESANGPWLLHGDKATVYAGSTIGQEPYAITRF